MKLKVMFKLKNTKGEYYYVTRFFESIVKGLDFIYDLKKNNIEYFAEKI